MVTITDMSSILNLSLLEVYFLCDEEKIDRQEEIIGRLNAEHNCLFHYNVILRGSVPYEKLPEKLIKEINRNNVFIHLVNGIHHYFNYGLEEIDMTESYESIKENVNDFIHEVCNFNITNLEMLNDRSTDSAFADMRDYEDNGVVKGIFKDLLDNKLSYSSDSKVKQLRVTIKNNTNTLSDSKSLALFQNAFGEVNPGVLGKEFFLTTPPNRKPNIKVRIAKVKSKTSQRQKYGIVMNIDDDCIELTFNNSNETMLYYATLLCEKAGIKFHPKYLVGSEWWPISNLMKETYGRISGKPFLDWLNQMKERPEDKTSAKSRIQRIILDVLKEKHPDAIYYCELNIERDLKGCYNIYLNSDEIELDEAFEDTFCKLLRDLYVERKRNPYYSQYRWN